MYIQDNTTTMRVTSSMVFCKTLAKCTLNEAIFLLAVCLVSTIFLLFQKWEYMNKPKDNSEESKLMKVLKEPRDWLQIETARAAA